MKHLKMGFRLILAFHPENERKYSSHRVSRSTQCYNESTPNARGVTTGASTRQILPDVTTTNPGQNIKKELLEGTGKETKAGKVWRGGGPGRREGER